ncbi:MAG: helix-hairpin-helix domain-containing protein [Oscillospiraceae bacterium]|nr:helix-hairpin-helix domain-containing protein [Oscillospiraceae bacterium]
MDDKYWGVRFINGSRANLSNAIAYCHILTHRGYLSKTLVKSHDCIAKKCPFFEKLKPDYWRSIEAEERKRKANRLKYRQKSEEKKDRDIFIREVLEDSGHIYITNIKDESPNLLVISYIYDRYVDLVSEIQFLRKKLGKYIKLQARTGTEEAIEQLIRKRRRETGKITDLRKAPKVGLAAKNRLASLGIYCLEDLFGRDGDELYDLDCELSGEKVNRRYLTAYRSAVTFANGDD